MSLISIIGIAVITYLLAGALIGFAIVKSGVIRKEYGLLSEILTVIYIIGTWPKTIQDMGVQFTRKGMSFTVNYDVEITDDEKN